jgi:hypothetical protein
MVLNRRIGWNPPAEDKKTRNSPEDKFIPQIKEKMKVSLMRERERERARIVPSDLSFFQEKNRANFF